MSLKEFNCLPKLLFSFLFFCSRKNCDELGQRFILAIVLPKDTLLTYGVRFNFTYRILLLVAV